MKVILKVDVRGIGHKYEIKEVSDGYANNFLFPKKLAEYASPEAVKKAEILRSATLAEMEIREELTKKQIETLKGVVITLQKKTNEKGHLFEKVHETQISESLKSQARIDIGVEFIKLESPIKEIGEHKVKVEIGKNRGEFVVVIEPTK
jgi:large subunit ribosomal protein L9